MRAGTFALSLLAAPLNVQVLQSLEDGPKSLVEVRRATGSPPQTTTRAHLRRLGELGVVDRVQPAKLPAALGFELSEAGRDLLPLATALDDWLAIASAEEPPALGSPPAKSTIKSLADGWSSTIVRALASRPLSLTELDRVISSLSYPSLERRLQAMRLAGLVKPHPARNRGTPYGATDWLRRAVRPLLMAARWEAEHASDAAAPVDRLDIEAALLLTMPFLRPDPSLSGNCQMTVDSGADQHGLAGVLLEVGGGQALLANGRIRSEADAVVGGAAASWLRAILEPDTAELELSGDFELANELVGSLQEALLAAADRA